MADGGGTGHPTVEMLASYADRTLTPDEALDIERHASICEACRDVLADTAAFLESDRTIGTREHSYKPKVARWRVAKPVAVALAAAAIIVLAVRTAPREWIPDWLSPDGARAVFPALVAAAADEPTRFSEGRLTGGFAYRPAPSLTRGTEKRVVSPDVGIAAARIEQRASGRQESAEDLAILGIAFLAISDPERAVPVLEQAARLAPDNPGIHSDLASAYLSRAGDADTDYQNALAAAERALASREPPIEAFFNRAVALERLGARDRAAEAWQDYLARDSSSPWAAEARQRVQKLTP
jgi:tetratricopeptide (TPR) repeat protein